MLRRRMKSYVLFASSLFGSVDIWNEEPGHTEGLNPAIQILVIDRVFVMVKSGDRTRHPVGKKGTAIDSRLGFDGPDGCSRPCTDSRGHSHRGSNGRKGEVGSTGNVKLTIGCIVVHVTLSRMGLEPGVLMWGDVLHFGVVGRTRIHRCVAMTSINQNAMRCACVRVAGVIICSRWENAGEGI